MADRECWQDLQRNRIFLISKTTGDALEVAKNYSRKPRYDTSLSGKATYQERRLTGVQASMPKLPPSLRKQSSLLKKYESESLNRSCASSKNSRYPSTSAGRYSVADQLEELEEQEARKSRQRYLSVQSHNSTEQPSGQSPLQEVEVEDDRQIFKLTRYHLSRKYPQSSYKFTCNPQSNDYSKPVPLHAHLTVSRKLIDKQMLIEALERKCMEPLVKPTRPAEESMLSLFQRKKQQVRNEMSTFNHRYIMQPKPILRSSDIQVGGMLEQQRRARLEAERRQKLLMQRFYLQANQLKERRQFQQQLQLHE